MSYFRLRLGPVVEDFEARLRPLRQEGPAWMASGKAHRERYRVPLVRGHVRLTLSSKKGEPVPVVGEGSILSLRYAGVVLLQGVMKRD